MQVTTFLMFTGAAEEAMRSYASLIPNSRLESIEHYGPGEEGQAGTVKRGVVVVGGTRLMCFDSPITHAFTFTPAISLFVDCDTSEQLEQAFDRLSENGQVLMPPNNYGFSRRFTWVQDRFGVSWQLNLP